EGRQIEFNGMTILLTTADDMEDVRTIHHPTVVKQANMILSVQAGFVRVLRAPGTLTIEKEEEAVKIDLGSGFSLEPDRGPRDSRFHKKIVRVTPTKEGHGNWVELECGHRCIAFGDIAHAGNRVLCSSCRFAAQAAQMSKEPQ